MTGRCGKTIPSEFILVVTCHPRNDCDQPLLGTPIWAYRYRDVTYLGKRLSRFSSSCVGIYLADWQHFVIPSKVPYLLAIAWISLYLRQLRWRDVGFRLYRDWPTTLAIGVTAGVAMEMLELFCTQPLLVRITGQMPDLSAFSRVAGNVRWLAISLALTWTLFAFGEELVFRGYLMDRIAGLLGRIARGWAVALAYGEPRFRALAFP